MLASRSWLLARGLTLAGARVEAKISLGQVVAICIERWEELGDGVKVEIAELLRRG